jgi:hypothetical protein
MISLDEFVFGGPNHNETSVRFGQPRFLEKFEVTVRKVCTRSMLCNVTFVKINNI